MMDRFSINMQSGHMQVWVSAETGSKYRSVQFSRGVVLGFCSRTYVSATLEQKFCALVVCFLLLSSAIVEYPDLKCSRKLESCLRMMETCKSSPYIVFLVSFSILMSTGFTVQNCLSLSMSFLSMLLHCFARGFSSFGSFSSFVFAIFLVHQALGYCIVK